MHAAATFLFYSTLAVWEYKSKANANYFNLMLLNSI